MSKSLYITQRILCAAFQNVEEHMNCGNDKAFESVNMRPTYRVRSQVQVDYRTTGWFPIQKGVTQGCILSPGLFNLYSKYIINTGGVGDMETGIGKLTENIYTRTHADETILRAE